MNIAAAIQAQMLQTLLSAMQAADQALKPGQSVRAAFEDWSTPDGKAPPPGQQGPAQVVIGQQRLTLMMSADATRAAALQPGAMLTLKVDQQASPQSPAQVRLTSITPPAGGEVPASITQGASGAARALVLATADAASPRLQAQAAAKLQGAVAADDLPASSPALAARAAAGPLIGAALARQDSLAPLLANLTALKAAMSDPVQAVEAVRIPVKVLAAAERVLAQQLPVADGEVGADELQQAVARSGVFHEALLARGQPFDAARDLKSALLFLRAALAGPDDQCARPDARPAAHAPPAGADAPRPAPPQREGLPVPQQAASASIDLMKEGAPAVLTRLGEQTDAALDRLSLSQFASLPSPQDASTGAPLNRWFTELPLALGDGSMILPMEIEEDGGGPGGAASPQGKIWRIRFALDVEPIGLIHALVTMQARVVSVAVWAEREATSRLVRDFAPDLQAALEDTSFDKAEIEVATGKPRARPASAGQFLDRVS